MKGILTILVLLTVLAGALAPAGGVREAWAGDLPDGTLATPESGRRDDPLLGSSGASGGDNEGDPGDAGDGYGLTDGPQDDDDPLGGLSSAGGPFLEGLFDFLMIALPLLP